MASIRPKIINSGFWSLGSNWFLRGLGLLKMIILARLLSPEDFGVIGLAMFSINILNVFSETGIESALIQRQQINSQTLNTAWTISLIRAFFIFILLFLGAGCIAAYFNSPILKAVLRVMALGTLLAGANNIGMVLFQKDLEFKSPAVLEMIADLCATLVTLLSAVWFRNLWVLVLGSITFAGLKFWGSYRLHPYRPRLCLNCQAAAELLSFGKHIFWISILAFIITNFDDALVGKMLGLAMLGFYTMAFNIASLPVTSLVGVISHVFLPAYARMHQEVAQIEEAFRRAFEAVMLMLLPLISVMIILAPGFTKVLLGEKWEPIVPALQVLCFFGLFRSVSSLFYPLHLGINRPDIQAKIKTLDLVTFLSLVYPLTLKWGIVGTSWTLVIVYLINMILNIIATVGLIELNLWRLCRSAIFPFFLASVVAAAAVALKGCELPGGELGQIALVAASSSVIVFGLTFICRRKLFAEVIHAIKIPA